MAEVKTIEMKKLNWRVALLIIIGIVWVSIQSYQIAELHNEIIELQIEIDSLYGTDSQHREWITVSQSEVGYLVFWYEVFNDHIDSDYEIHDDIVAVIVELRQRIEVLESE